MSEVLSPQKRKRFDPVLEDRIGVQTEIRGLVSATGKFQFNGHLSGSLIHRPEHGETLWIGPQARVQGTVLADKVVIHGTVEGDVYAQSHVRISHLGHVKGRVFCQVLQIDFGGVLNGESTTHMTSIQDVIKKKIQKLSNESF